jgi:hypothetical protein
MYTLTSSELNTLHVIADPNSCDAMPRAHLEKFSRLALIEPASCGVALSPLGREMLKSN